jgi:hypothetical protein
MQAIRDGAATMLMVAMLAAPARAQAIGQVPPPPSLGVWLAMGFTTSILLDSCEAHEDAAAFREMLESILHTCPTSDDDRSDYEAYTQDLLHRFEFHRDQHIALYGQPPVYHPEGKTCAAYLQDRHTLVLLRIIRLYREHTKTAMQALDVQCGPAPGAPD